MSVSTGDKSNQPQLSDTEIEANFADMHPPLSRSEALVAADRCYFCYDAPCTTACPTGIDIPGFIQSIRSDNIRGSARTILQENIMGGMCARVCPTEILCEQACVRHAHEEKPVDIGLLQRYSTDPVIRNNEQLFDRAASSGFKVAIVGGGPASLSCAHRLATLGHAVVVFNQTEKLGGLNEFGIAAYKTVDDFAQREVNYILGVGGIDVRNGVQFGKDISLQPLRDEYDAVFLGFGMGGVNSLGLEEIDGVVDAVDYIATLRQATNKSSLPVGQNIVVIGGGMTAIDIAVQSKKLGAECVTIVYRRGPDNMNASPFEQHYAQTQGVVIRHWLSPLAMSSSNGKLTGIDFSRTRIAADGKLSETGESVHLVADVVFTAIGQRVLWSELGDADKSLELVRDRIRVDSNRRTSLDNVWAGGDCVADGEDLTVSAVQDGKLAAIDIDGQLRQNQS